MNRNNAAAAAALERIGVSISYRAAPTEAWGWSMRNAKLVRDWSGPYPTETAALEAALDWLLEHARKGVLCEHLHAAVTDNGAVPIEADTFDRPWPYNPN